MFSVHGLQADELIELFRNGNNYPLYSKLNTWFFIKKRERENLRWLHRTIVRRWRSEQWGWEKKMGDAWSEGMQRKGLRRRWRCKPWPWTSLRRAEALGRGFDDRACRHTSQFTHSLLMGIWPIFKDFGP